MININLDKTYCASKNCKNKCGRKLELTKQQMQDMMQRLLSCDPKDYPIWYSYFCDENGEPIEYLPSRIHDEDENGEISGKMLNDKYTYGDSLIGALERACKSMYALLKARKK